MFSAIIHKNAEVPKDGNFLRTGQNLTEPAENGIVYSDILYGIQKEMGLWTMAGLLPVLFYLSY